MLLQEGWEVNRKRVYRTLREEQMLKRAGFSRPWVEETGSLETAGPNERRYMDLTYLEITVRGPCPLNLVQDACTREIVGYGPGLLPSLPGSPRPSLPSRLLCARPLLAGAHEGRSSVP